MNCIRSFTITLLFNIIPRNLLEHNVNPLQSLQRPSDLPDPLVSPTSLPSTPQPTTPSFRGQPLSPEAAKLMANTPVFHLLGTHFPEISLQPFGIRITEAISTQKPSLTISPALPFDRQLTILLLSS